MKLQSVLAGAAAVALIAVAGSPANAQKYQ